MSNVTPEDLISYLYGETDAKRTAEIEFALSESWALREKLSVLQTSMQRLDKATPLWPMPRPVLKPLKN
jgi:hypothetical protein